MGQSRPGSDRPSKNGRASSSYDLEMIRDFLDHLMWELRVVHFENTNAPGTDHGELMSQLQKYQRKYPGSTALMAMTVMKTDGYSQDDIGRARRKLRWMRAQQAEDAIELLEALEPVFEEALTCAAMSAGESPDQLPCRQVDPDALLADKGGEGDEG